MAQVVEPSLSTHFAPDGAGAARPDVEIVAVEGPFRRMVDNTTGQHSLQVIRAFKAGEVLSPLGAKTVSGTPTMYTVQVSETEHIDLAPEILQFANHSCKPSVFFNTADRVMEALVDLEVGDVVTFFYPCTEYKMSCPFVCTCGAACCLGTIKGAADLPAEVLAKYRLNSHIKRLLEHGV